MADRARPDDPRSERPPRADRPSRADPGALPAVRAGGERAPRPNILTSLQISTPLEEFRRHCEKKQRSFEGATEGRASEIYRRAFELAESLIRRHDGGDGRC